VAVLSAALAALADGPPSVEQALSVEQASMIVASAPLGPSRRRYANAAAIVATSLAPEALLDRLKGIERAFGRRMGGMRWGARVLDLDIVLWSGGRFASRRLAIPHRELPHRSFVLLPARQIAGDWRDPRSGLTVRHLTARLTRPRPATRAQASRPSG